MPIKSCRSNGKPGYKWGDSGKCYTYDPNSESSKKAAKKKAIKQGVAIGKGKMPKHWTEDKIIAFLERMTAK